MGLCTIEDFMIQSHRRTETYHLNLVTLFSSRIQLGGEGTAVCHYAQTHMVNKKEESNLGFQRCHFTPFLKIKMY